MVMRKFYGTFLHVFTLLLWIYSCSEDGDDDSSGDSDADADHILFNRLSSWYNSLDE